jgi:hypothetical protein
MSPEVVHDQKDFALGKFDRPSEKLSEGIRLQASLINHKSNFTSIADRRDHAGCHAADESAHYRSLTVKRIPPPGVILITDSSFIAP